MVVARMKIFLVVALALFALFLVRLTFYLLSFAVLYRYRVIDLFSILVFIVALHFSYSSSIFISLFNGVVNLFVH